MQIKHREYLRSLFFGFEDSLVSTAGLIAGISIGSANSKFVFLAGIVAVSIEAVSMGIGEYLSDDALQELDKLKRHKDNSLISGLFMFVSYLLAGLILLIPILLLSFPYSLMATLTLAFICLFSLGVIKGQMLHTSAIKGGLKILLVGGIATIFGVLVGYFFKIA